MTAELTGPPLLFVDLDGTVRWGHDELVAHGARNEWVNGPDDVVIFPEALVMMRRWRDLGGRIYGVTNQAGVAAGHMTLETCQAALAETDQQARDEHGRLFERILACAHATDAGCFCRKPSPGLLFLAAEDARRQWGFSARDRCLMVGDRDEDQAAAAAAGVPFEHADNWRSKAGDA